MLSTILEIIKEFLKNLPLLDRWLTKPTEEKVQDGAKAIDDKISKEESTGRPQ